MPRIPTIKGIFVQSHIEKLRKEKGDGAVLELERRFGRPLYFRRLEDVPVRDEAAIIALAFDILNEGHGLHGAARERAAGRLHFSNFSGTTLGSVLLHSMPHTIGSLRTILFNSGSIARTVFKRLEFSASDVRGGIRIVMTHTDYPPEHFQGFFEAWLEEWGLEPNVSVKVKSQDVHEYLLEV